MVYCCITNHLKIYCDRTIVLFFSHCPLGWLDTTRQFSEPLASVLSMKFSMCNCMNNWHGVIQHVKRRHNSYSKSIYTTKSRYKDISSTRILQLKIIITPNSEPISSLPHPSWQPQVCFLSLWAYFCFVDGFTCVIF